MYNLETQATLGTYDTEQRQTKQKTTHKTKKMGNTYPQKKTKNKKTTG